MTTSINNRGPAVPTEFLGIKFSTLAWGFVGGATAAIFGPSTWTYLVLVTFVGTITSTVFGPIGVHVAHKLALKYVEVSVEDITPPVIFLCGLTGMWLCAGVIESAKRLRRDAPEAVSRLLKSKQ